MLINFKHLSLCVSVLRDSYHTLLDGVEWPSFLEVVAFFFFFPFLREELMKFYGVECMKLQNDSVKVPYSG